MSDDKPYLTLVDNATQPNDDEFAPLPFYPWDERPPTLPLDHDECATALHLSHGDIANAAELLKVPIIRLTRLLKSSPRLQTIQSEALGVALAKAASLPIRTLFDPSADRRAQEWASTKLLQSRLAMGHPLSPAPPSPAQSASLSVNTQSRSLTFRWRTDADTPPSDDDDSAA